MDRFSFLLSLAARTKIIRTSVYILGLVYSLATLNENNISHQLNIIQPHCRSGRSNRSAPADFPADFPGIVDAYSSMTVLKKYGSFCSIHNGLISNAQVVALG